ncbi:MAG: hypothetical protein EP298_08480 [Gammaproteobacteria bacterium]|nr:MAG: hypothetical protein EP298_08480 [Gammaproteobacteria bacterium]UTW42839.1 hypothetical protein KFE69_01480 [bacterium SCSIO 12844]
MTFIVFKCPINEYRGSSSAAFNKKNSFQIAADTFNQFNLLKEPARSTFLKTYDTFAEAKAHAKIGEKYTYQDIILETDSNDQSMLSPQAIVNIHYFSNEQKWVEINKPSHLKDKTTSTSVPTFFDKQSEVNGKEFSL